MMMGCQATRYLSQSSSCPYRTCVFSQLEGDEGIKESTQRDERWISTTQHVILDPDPQHYYNDNNQLIYPIMPFVQ